MEDDGITNCGNAQNCVQVCPMSLPLTRAIYETNREVTIHGLFGWLKKIVNFKTKKGRHLFNLAYDLFILKFTFIELSKRRASSQIRSAD